MTRKKVEEFSLESTPRRVKDVEIDVSYDMPCSNKITELMKYLSTLVIKYGQDADIEIQETYDEYDSRFRAKVISYRDETPKEVEKRIAKAKKDKEKALVQRIRAKEKEAERKKKEEQEELELLDRLQKKYKGYAVEQLNGG